MDRLRVMVLVCTLSLLASACGARLTDEQRTFAIGAAAGGAAGDAAAGGAASSGLAGGTTAGSGGVAAGQPATAEQTLPSTSRGAATSAPSSTGAGTGGTAGNGAQAGGESGGEAGVQQPAQDGDQAGQGGQPGQAGQPQGQAGQPTDTRAAPPGGNGGATDTGVTTDTIMIANAADISGAVPGLFEDAQKAVAAYVAYFTATEGTVYGRQLELQSLDTKMSTSGNRNAYLQACDQAFATVGSMSAFDEGAAPVIQQCSLPDLRTAAVNRDIQTIPTAYSTDAMQPDKLPVSQYNFWKEQAPEAVKHAAFLYISSDTTEYQTAQVRSGTQKIGYEWVYVQPIDLSETNYSGFVLKMKEKGVQFVTIQASYQQAVRLAQAMKQQDFHPTIYALQSNMYTPKLIEQGGDAVEGVQIALPSVMVEDSARYPEMQTYATWLTQVDPNASPTGLGLYAWSAAKLFVHLLKQVGPDLTRQKLVAAISDVHDWDGGGLLPPQDIGNRMPSDCINILEIKGGRFVRIEPTDPNTKFRCDNQVVSFG